MGLRPANRDEDQPEYARHIFNRMFFRRNCVDGCGASHVVNGVEMKIGPPRNGIPKQRSRAWVEDDSAAHQKLSPGSIMPPDRLSLKDMRNLTTYLLALPE